MKENCKIELENEGEAIKVNRKMKSVPVTTVVSPTNLKRTIEIDFNFGKAKPMIVTGKTAGTLDAAAAVRRKHSRIIPVPCASPLMPQSPLANRKTSVPLQEEPNLSSVMPSRQEQY
mgnify:CR=1 FL=1